MGLLSHFLQEIRRRGLKVSVVGIPKTIDNDIPVLALRLFLVLILLSYIVINLSDTNLSH